MSAREKYPDFVTSRTFRRLSKRATDPNADEDGMREYSHLHCPHCNKDDIAILTDNIKFCKATVVQDHLRVCPDYTGVRPNKRGKSTAASTAIVPYTCSNPLHGKLQTEHDKLQTKHDKMQSDVEELKRNSEMQAQQLNALQSFCVQVTSLAGLTPPQELPTIIREIGNHEKERLLLKSQDAVEVPRSAPAVEESMRETIGVLNLQLEKATTREQEREKEVSVLRAAEREAQSKLTRAQAKLTEAIAQRDKETKEKQALDGKLKDTLKALERAKQPKKHEPSLLGGKRPRA